jgi:hypothetical protein
MVVYARSGALRLEGVSQHTALATGLQPVLPWRADAREKNMSCSCSCDVVWAGLGELWRSLACRDGELSGVELRRSKSSHWPKGLLSVRVRVGEPTPFTFATLHFTISINFTYALLTI